MVEELDDSDADSAAELLFPFSFVSMLSSADTLCSLPFILASTIVSVEFCICNSELLRLARFMLVIDDEALFLLLFSFVMLFSDV